MDTTFDMKKVKPETLKGQATYNQCEGLAKKFSYGLKGKEWGESYSRIRACLLNERSEGTLSFQKASDLYKKKKLPKVYTDKISNYLDIHSG
tara:strand:+ start:182 stop:457 length:276 start_codon:yes stop_codon:yes gene_type:complete